MNPQYRQWLLHQQYLQQYAMQQAMLVMQNLVSCKISVKNDGASLAFKIMPGEGMSMDQLKERFGEMINLASNGVPVTMYAAGRPYFSGVMGHSSGSRKDPDPIPRDQPLEEYIYYI